MLNSCIITGIGDVCEQKLEIYGDDLNKFDWERLKNVSIAGTLTGVMCHYWYLYLDAHLPEKKITLRSTIKIIAMDLVLFAPLTVAAFLITYTVLDQMKYEEFVEEVQDNVFNLYMAEVFSWVPAQILTFYYVKQQYRVLVDNLLVLMYDVMISYNLNVRNKN